MASLFTKIIRGEVPSYKIAESEDFYAFLDVNPLAKGHTLVVPKKEIDYLFDLEDDLLARMQIFAKKVALGIEQVVPCERIGVVVLGLEIPHAHIHLIPINHESDIDFKQPRVNLTESEMATIAKEINEQVVLS